MAAKKNDPRREARIAKNNRNLNSALTLFTAGFIAEFYLRRSGRCDRRLS